MSKFPARLESVLQDVEALIDKEFKSKKASENIKRSLRSAIEAYNGIEILKLIVKIGTEHEAMKEKIRSALED